MPGWWARRRWQPGESGAGSGARCWCGRARSGAKARDGRRIVDEALFLIFFVAVVAVVLLLLKGVSG